MDLIYRLAAVPEHHSFLLDSCNAIPLQDTRKAVYSHVLSNDRSLQQHQCPLVQIKKH